MADHDEVCPNLCCEGSDLLGWLTFHQFGDGIKAKLSQSVDALV
jgi:hypothetical protein